jgi:hypothetical protein
MTQDTFVLLFVAAAAVYMVLRLRRVASGQSKCACGTKSCGAAAPCARAAQRTAANGGAGEGLPLLPPACGQGGCGKK